LPTMKYVIDGSIPSWSEGTVLPPYKTISEENAPDVFAIQSKGTKKTEPILRATAMMVRRNHKLTRFWGYEQLDQELIELYDLDNDPQELNNLYQKDDDLSAELLNGLLNKLDEVERQRKEMRN